MNIQKAIKNLLSNTKKVIAWLLNCGWINVEDDIPEDGEKVIIYGCQCNTNIKWEQMVAQRVCGAWFSYPGGYELCGKVTHWRHLNKPPKDKKGANK